MKYFLRILLAAVLGMATNVASAYYANIDGIYYDFSGTKEATVTYSNLTANNKYAYSGSVTIPETVTYGSNTYSVTSIGYAAFQGCTGLTSVEIPNSVTWIGDYAFRGCSGLTSVTIGNSVTSIGNYAFYECSGLTSIEIPNSVTWIGDYAFWGCSGLTSIVIGNSVTSIGNCAFYECSGLTSITIPESVTSIGHAAFTGCTDLTSITIPESVIKIGENAFLDTAWYDNQSDGVVYAGKVAYRYKGTMPDNTEIVLEEGTLGIGGIAFSDCTGLTSITIPNSVISIGDSAFSHCTGLTSVTIPESVTSIGYYAFWGCTGLTSISIPESVTEIGYSMFRECTGLTSVTIPNSVTSIKKWAFYNCTALASVTIPGSVTSIGDEAFSGCTGLKELSLNDSENYLSLGNGVFGCPLETVYIGRNVYYGTLIYDWRTTLTTLTIGDKVSAISSKAFSGCTGLKEVSLGSGLTTVGDQAFSGCTNIESLTLDCKDIKAWFADAKESVKEVTLGKHVESIAEDTFKDFSSLLRCSFGSVESLFGITFGNVQANPLSITQTLNIDKKVVTTIAIPKGITEIKDYVLYNCNSVNTVTGGPDVKRIGKYAFYYARKLNTLHIGDNVETIGEEAFWGCPLTSIHCYAEYPPTCDKFVFNIEKPNCKLYVRPGSVDMYSVHQDWYEFNILSLDDEALGIEAVNVNSNETDSETLRCEKGIYDLSGRKVNDDETLRYDNYPSKLKKGIYIVNGRKTVVR